MSTRPKFASCSPHCRFPYYNEQTKEINMTQKPQYDPQYDDQEENQYTYCHTTCIYPNSQKIIPIHNFSKVNRLRTTTTGHQSERTEKVDHSYKQLYPNKRKQKNPNQEKNKYRQTMTYKKEVHKHFEHHENPQVHLYMQMIQNQKQKNSILLEKNIALQKAYKSLQAELLNQKRQSQAKDHKIEQFNQILLKQIVNIYQKLQYILSHSKSIQNSSQQISQIQQFLTQSAMFTNNVSKDSCILSLTGGFNSKNTNSKSQGSPPRKQDKLRSLCQGKEMVTSIIQVQSNQPRSSQSHNYHHDQYEKNMHHHHSNHHQTQKDHHHMQRPNLDKRIQANFSMGFQYEQHGLEHKNRGNLHNYHNISDGHGFCHTRGNREIQANQSCSCDQCHQLNYNDHTFERKRIDNSNHSDDAKSPSLRSFERKLECGQAQIDEY